MPTYRIEEEDEPSLGFQIIMYAVMFTILLPIGVIYLIYKLIKWAINRKKEKKEAEQAALLENESRRRAMHAETTERILRLKKLYDKGGLTADEFEQLMAIEKANLFPADSKPPVKH